MAKAAKDIGAAVREVCLWLPETSEVSSHGSPDFRVRGKTFATYVVNHHGDGRVALWLNAPRGAQELYVGEEPRYFFVPPYVGPRGWLGIHLNKGMSWKRIAGLVREAYEKVAPPALTAQLGKTIEISPPTAGVPDAQLNPLGTPQGKKVLKVMREICLELPETSEAVQFGYPVWRAGAKTFAGLYSKNMHAKAGKLIALFWAGAQHQSLLTSPDTGDARYEIPAYMGHNGWISLDVSKRVNKTELAELASWSYRHFALKRMLKTLDGPV